MLVRHYSPLINNNSNQAYQSNNLKFSLYAATFRTEMLIFVCDVHYTCTNRLKFETGEGNLKKLSHLETHKREGRRMDYICQNSAKF